MGYIANITIGHFYETVGYFNKPLGTSLTSAIHRDKPFTPLSRVEQSEANVARRAIRRKVDHALGKSFSNEALYVRCGFRWSRRVVGAHVNQ
jgi:hypothetical protein